MNFEKSYNGRVDLLNNKQGPNLENLFSMYDKIPAHQCTTLRNATEGLWNETTLSNAYFSKENIQIIQNGIRAGVYQKSNGKYLIAPQDCDVLKIIMRSIFLQYSINLKNNITQQIEELNNYVINYCIQQAYNSAQSYLKYLYDASTLVVPLSTPIMTSQRDKNNYLMPNWF